MADKHFRYVWNIWVLDNYTPYRQQVVHYLDLMRTTEAGKLLCQFINQQSDKWLSIIPYKPTAAEPRNATASEESWADAAPKNYPVWGVLTSGQLTLPVPLGLGTGKGSSVIVRYHPATWREYMKRSGHMLPGAGPGEVLYHEMLHALRMMTGTLRQDKIAGFEGFDDIEEFYAILAANVYRSQRGFKVHRLNHHGFKAQGDEYEDSEAYYTIFKDQIDAWFREQPDFCLKMARLVSKFNPFRAAAVIKGLIPGPVTSMTL